MPQGTIKSFDHATRSAVLLDDQMKIWDVEPAAIAGAELLELRIGQRVRYTLEDDGDGGKKVANLHFLTL